MRTAVPASTPPASDDAPETPAVGKGRATPKRSEQEAARRRPLVADTKEARAAAKADLQARRNRARIGMENGEEKYLPPRDKGPQRRWVRDYVDAGWHLSEWVMAMMIVVIIAALMPITTIAYGAMIALWIFMLLAVLDMVLLAWRVKRKAAAKFGKERLERGLGWYAAMRSLQMRFMRLPKAQVKRGQYPD
ncbi:DUF3043 domain-containing protein [Microbacterium bovistercoris]|uniref:DUF3043 domain-containing protein n=1 Tax=Microbacterium bovistercoris TaxID=2293570 RepID=A0A371NR08_9MICO|nr:DUF3043 domain-containing protein [Microbacterium bovistercoris]REJ04608.1 DUF3043 domain-containing protein [Microbacterium bovistercoris]